MLIEDFHKRGLNPLDYILKVLGRAVTNPCLVCLQADDAIVDRPGSADGIPVFQEFLCDCIGGRDPGESTPFAAAELESPDFIQTFTQMKSRTLA